MDKNIRASHSNKLSGYEQVLDYLQQLEHPLKTEIEEVRKIILGINDQVSEHIKWNAPSFCMNNQDRITFNFRVKEGFRLVFHCGSKKTTYENKGPLFKDETELLDWVTGDRATIHITSASDFEDKRNKLIEVATKWIEVTKNI
ncbi:protein of unknown function (DU1801) [Paenibacillus algorifonticola]|uniref:YdhG-like domain-containing protein n=1 Tax=Paenibacillus algorifonticola TaxID=684063 RepID=A0A1I2GL06_9BACL|nr:DUF1801 domain-containing protein [Paenibacillus algorifonticola]SFF17527.1 protein of unknown function (DU1801) [Paenibacillus algorifonticola]